MISVCFEHTDLLGFARIFVDRISQLLGAEAARQSDGNEVTFADCRVGWLFQRLSRGQPTVLPFPGVRVDSWLITGPVLSELNSALAQLGRFVVPSYAAFTSDTSRPQLLGFDATGSRLQQLGARLDLPGYYRWESPPANRDIILDRLNLWRDLTARRPPIRKGAKPTYAEPEEKFREALILHDWTGAENSLTALRRLNVTSAENLLSLEFMLAARHRQWLKIWSHPNFTTAVDLRLPRSVRSAMLDAVHQAVLAPHEESGDWDAALQAFEESLPRLGRLLLSRAGLRTESAIRVFAYHAVTAGDSTLMNELLNEDVSPTVREQLNILASKMPPQDSVPTNAEGSEALRLRAALEQGDVDSAYVIALDTDDPVKRVTHLVEVTIQSRDEYHAREALRHYDSLVQEDAENLERNYPFVGEVLSSLRDRLGIAEPENVEPSSPRRSILSWSEGLKAAAKDPMAPNLLAALDLLPSEFDEREWPESELEEIFYGLAAIQEAREIASLSHIDRSLSKLSGAMMRGAHFPRMDNLY